MIRAQYHFRKSSRGLLAWDVRRLVQLSSELPVRQVPVAAIAELDEDHWYADGSGTPNCRSIAEHCALILATDLSYPIILDVFGRVMDGMHPRLQLWKESQTYRACNSERILNPTTSIEIPNRSLRTSPVVRTDSPREASVCGSTPTLGTRNVLRRVERAAFQRKHPEVT